MRCDRELPCGEGDTCYRGFCVPEVGRVISPQVGDASIIYVEVESDGSIMLVESQAPVQSEDPDAPRGPFTSADGGTKAAPDASVATPVDASVARPDASIFGRPDAAITPADAAVPPVGPCSNKECCDEAKNMWEEDDDDKPGKGKKKCGCDNIVQALACGLL